MSDLEVFEIDDEFDPLATDSLDDLEEDNPNDEYSVPVIPDAERSVVPAPVELSPAERIEHMLKGIPGQQFRILACVQACMGEPAQLSRIIEVVDAEYPTTGSVYGTGRLVQLLEAAGAIERIEPQGMAPGDDELSQNGSAEEQGEAAEGEEAAGDEGAGNGSSAEDAAPAKPLEHPAVDPGQEYVEVELARPCTFAATQAGIDAVEARHGMERMEDLLAEEPQYLPVYKRLLTMCRTPQGRLVQEINAVIDPDPLCKEPRRFATYFLRKLELAGAIRFVDAWQTTDYGKKALELGILADADEAGDLGAAEAAREKQLAKEAKFEAEKAERERYAAELAAKKAEEAARAVEAGEPLPQPERPHGSGGPLFAFPYTPPANDEDDAPESASSSAHEPLAAKPVTDPVTGSISQSNARPTHESSPQAHRHAQTPNQPASMADTQQ